MSAYEKLIEFYLGSAFYKEFGSHLPYPFNNPYVEIVVIGAIILMNVIGIIDFIGSEVRLFRAKRKVRRKETELQRAKLEAEEKNRERNEMMDKYMRFLMIAQMQNNVAGQSVTYEQFKEVKEEMDVDVEYKELPKAPKIKEKIIFKKPSPEALKRGPINAQAAKIQKVSTDNRNKKIEKVCEEREEQVEENFVIEQDEKEIPTETVEDAKEIAETTSEEDTDETLSFPIEDFLDDPFYDSQCSVPPVISAETELDEDAEGSVIDVAAIMQDKLDEDDSSDEPTEKEMNEFERLMLRLQQKEADKEKNSQIKKEADEIQARNLEVLNRKIEKTLQEAPQVQSVGTSEIHSKYDKELEERIKAAKKAKEKEESESQRKFLGKKKGDV